MTGTKIAFSWVALAGAGILAVFLCAGQARAQAGPEGPTFESIEVTGARPVARAMDVIEQRYGVLIDYMDPPYVAPQDLQLVRSLHGKLVGVPFQVPKDWTISVQYWQVPGTPKSVAPIYRCNTATLGCAPLTARPQEGIRALIQEVLYNLAEQGGPIFAVRSLDMPYGARWEVYPIEALDRSGTMAAQLDLLSSTISIPKARRWPAEMFQLIAQQLTQASGSKFSVGDIPGLTVNASMPGPGERPPELGADGVSAWRAIADLMGPRATLGALRLFYDVENGTYLIHVVGLPYREPPRPPTPAPVPARALPPRDIYPAGWLQRAHMPEGVREVQQTLASLGYLSTPPTASWDANAVAALKRFQQAAGLPQTGKFDLRTAMKLWPSLPRHLRPVTVRATPAMSVALLDWLNSTPDGWKEVQRTLAKEGFYNGPIDGHLYLPMREAMKAFQTANGLEPTGGLDWATAVKLSPYLPQPK
jgi:Putative peptidoglycan binding domain